MKNLKSESGRSMVEMLGVLAIIGVLSVGGIAGYKTAIKKHQSNELANALQLLDVQYGSAKNAGKCRGMAGEEGVSFSYDSNGFNIKYTDYRYDQDNSGDCYSFAYVEIKSPYEITDEMCKTLHNFDVNEKHQYKQMCLCIEGCSEDTTNDWATNDSSKIYSTGGTLIRCHCNV